MRKTIRPMRSAISMSAAVAAITLAVSAGATEPANLRELGNPERMTQPATPGDAPGVRRDFPQNNVPAPSVQPQPEESGKAAVATPHEAAKPEIDPAVATEEKPGAAQEEAEKNVKDPKQTAAESAHERSFGTAMNDAYLTARVKASLAIDSATPAADINVDTENGEVTLFGIVPSDDSKSAAEADARGIAGVAQVKNELQIVAEDRRSDVTARDTELQGSLERNLEPYPSMNGVYIDVKNCVVRLTGTVPPGTEHDEAMQAVRKTPGVCLVKDELKFAAS